MYIIRWSFAVNIRRECSLSEQLSEITWDYSTSLTLATTEKRMTKLDKTPLNSERFSEVALPPSVNGACLAEGQNSLTAWWLGANDFYSEGTFQWPSGQVVTSSYLL